MAIFDEYVDWPGIERIKDILRRSPPPVVAWTGMLIREGSLLDRLRRDPGRPENVAIEPAVCTVHSTGASSMIPVEWGERRVYAGPMYNLILDDDGTPKLDANGQWIWKRRE